MTTEEVANWQDEVDALNAAITKQGGEVRTLKKSGADADAIAEAVEALKALKIQAEVLAKQQVSKDAAFARKAFDDLILRKMFVVPSFEIHGGVKGLFDLGPPACALKVSGQWKGKWKWNSKVFDGTFFRHICVHVECNVM
jgi:glycyl-tRNA synthetase